LNSQKNINSAHSSEFDSDSIISSIGESYEYVRILVSNSFEIKKLEFLLTVKSFAGKLLLGITMLFFSFFIFAILIVLGIYQLYIALGSLSHAMLITVGFLLLLIFIIYMSRNIFIYRKVERKMNSLVDPKAEIN